MPDYAEIYLHNCYEVVFASDITLSFSLQYFKDDPFFDRPFGIITAFNPDNKTLTYQENLLRNQILYNELNSKYDVLEAKGCYDGHCEEGFIVFDISLSDTIEFGCKYEQYSIFYNSAVQLKYVNCKNEKVIVEKEREAPKSQ